MVKRVCDPLPRPPYQVVMSGPVFEGLKPVRPADFVPGAARGVSTVCWGPQLWQVLHGIAFHVKTPALVARLVTLLGVLLPCKFCRESWPAFVAQLVTDTGKTVAAHVADGTFPHFLYDAHNLVNDKLMRQRMKDAAAVLAPALSTELGLSAVDDATVAAALCAAAERTRIYGELDKRPSFECVTKRYYIAGATPFACDAVWRALLMFTLNFAPDKATLLVEFLRVLAACVRACGPTLAHTSRMLVRAADALEARASANELDQRAVFGVLALSQAACDGTALPTREARSRYLSDLHERIEVAAAGVCLNGVCK